MSRHKSFIYKFFIVVLLFSCWSCYDEPIEVFPEKTPQSGKLTIEEARTMFARYYMAHPVSRSFDSEESAVPLNPGMITPDWAKAAQTSNEVNSYVNVPILAGRKHYVKSPRNEAWVEVPQKLVAVQEDSSQRKNLYIMSIVPEGIFAYKQANAYIYHCNGAEIPKGFSGLIIYTKPTGGIPSYVAHYDKGALTQDVFLFDKANALRENIATINAMLTGYRKKSIRNKMASLSRSEGWFDDHENENEGCECCSGCVCGEDLGPCNCPCDNCAGKDDDEWIYRPEGDPQTGKFDNGDEFLYWYSEDEDGNAYFYIDTDGDGTADSFLNGKDVDIVGEDGSQSTPADDWWMFVDWDALYPEEEGEDDNFGGDVNPGGGTITGGGGGSSHEDNKPSQDSILPNVELMNEDNFVGYDISDDCMAGCKLIMDKYGVPYGSSAHVYQLLAKENNTTVYYDKENYKTIYQQAIDCINRHLDNNRPIIVGVDYKQGSPNHDGITDHWIVVTGRGYDEDKQMYYYTYMDTGRYQISAAGACDTKENRLYYDDKNYTFRDSESYHTDKPYDVTQVRPNDGKNLDETISMAE